MRNGTKMRKGTSHVLDSVLKGGLKSGPPYLFTLTKNGDVGLPASLSRPFIFL